MRGITFAPHFEPANHSRRLCSAYKLRRVKRVALVYFTDKIHLHISVFKVYISDYEHARIYVFKIVAALRHVATRSDYNVLAVHPAIGRALAHIAQFIERSYREFVLKIRQLAAENYN